MIDIEALATPAFVAEVLAGGTLAGMRVNTAGRVRSELLRCLMERPADARGRSGTGHLTAGLQRCVEECSAVDVPMTTTRQGELDKWCAALVPIVGCDERVTAVLGICREIAAPARITDHLSLTLRAIHGAEWHYDVAQGLYRGSDEIATLLGEDAPRPVAWAEWLERVYPQDLGSFLTTPAHDGRVEFRFHGAGGELRWARCSRVAVPGEDGETEAVLGIMVDITQERVRETAWVELATHDPLTGLLNRRGLRDEIDHLQAEMPLTSCLALFAIDLDHFKTTNDNHGHAAGDAVLVEAARRLAATVEGTICARLGGDEFIAVVRMASEAEAHRLRDRLMQEFRRPLAFCGQWLPVSASVGVACGSGSVDTVRLMDAADRDLYARKHARARAATNAA